MKRVIKKGILPLSALFILIIIVLINTTVSISPSQWNKFEIMSNALMFVVAVAGFFLRGLSDKAVGTSDIGNILGNVAVSGIAFWMNVTVLGHAIRFEQLWDSLWGWPLGWIILALIQVLFLSELGKKLLALIGAFWEWCQSVKGALKGIGSELVNAIIQNKGIFLIALIGFILWGVYLGIQIYFNGIGMVFAGTDIFELSIWFWVTYSVIFVLLYGILESSKRVKEIIQNLDGKKVLVVLAIMVLAFVVGVIPVMLKVIAVGILIPLITIVGLCFVVRKMHKLRKDIESGNYQEDDSKSINIKDLCFVVISFVGVPLSVICVIAWIQIHNGQSSVTKAADNVSIWLDYVNIAGDVAKRLLDLFM